MSRRFSKFLRKKQASKRYDSKKSSEFNSNKYTCYGCGEEEHIKSECPNNEVKKKGDFKREKKGKAKKTYIAWDDNDVSSLSSSDDEEANLCLLASVTSSMDSTSTSKGPMINCLMLFVPTRSSVVMTCLARDHVGRAQQNTWTRER